MITRTRLNITFISTLPVFSFSWYTAGDKGVGTLTTCSYIPGTPENLAVLSRIEKILHFIPQSCC